MNVLHIASEGLEERFQKMLLPLCDSRSNLTHRCVYLSRVQPILSSDNLKWVETKNFMDTRTVAVLSHIISEEKPDVVHLHGVELIPMLLAANPGVKFKRVVSTYRPKSSNWLKKSIDILLEQSTRWVDLVCFNSFELESTYVGSGFPAKKAYVLYDGVLSPKVVHKAEFWSWASRFKSSLEENNFFVVFPGSARKGFLTWLKGLSKMPNDLRPLVFLEEDDYKTVEKSAKEMKFVKKMPQEFRLIAAAESSGCIVANKKYQLSLNLAEYLHLGCPIIASSESGAGELVINNFNGRLCSSQRTEEWSQTFTELTKDYALKEKLRKASRSVASGELTIVRWAERMERMYDHLFLN